MPVEIATTLADRSSPVNVFNEYNVGGLLTGIAAPNARVAIDGRTDIWSSEYVAGYIADTRGDGDWRSRVDSLDPDVAVLRSNSEVTRGLTLERQWRVVLEDSGWVLLEPPP